MIKILFFGRLSDFAEPIVCDLPKEVTTTQQLIKWLGREDVPLQTALSIEGNRVAVNQVLVSEDYPIKKGDEIAFMSPLSGG